MSYLKDVLAVEAVHLDHHLVSCVSDVAAVHEQGLFLRTWTVNDRRRAEQLLDWGVDMVMSDYPDQLLISGLSPSFGWQLSGWAGCLTVMKAVMQFVQQPQPFHNYIHRTGDEAGEKITQTHDALAADDKPS